jgi:alpha-N-arabinofuranosidase
MAAGAALAVTGPGSMERKVRAQPVAAGPRAGGEVSVLVDQPIRGPDGKPAVINPMVHGHFVEHIGGVVYDGIWVGPDSPIPNDGGIRRSLLESLQRLEPPVYRWPGGCFADKYHWRDGIGPPASRPRRFNRWREAVEPNTFGTHEFLRFCKLTGAVPYLAANVGTGDPEEFQRWVEYCNAPPGRTSLADEREANGQREPFQVRIWGVGNESWGCGGKFTPEDYCVQYRRFSEWVPSFGVPLYFIASGPNGNDLDWTRRFMKKWADGSRAPLQAWSPHYYCGTAGTSTEFTADEWFILLERASRIEKLITDQWAVLGEFDRGHAIKLAIDEWGCWHPEDKRLPAEHLFAQYSTLRDALVAGLTLDAFHRHADKVAMANVAQLINCLHSLYMTEGDKLVETPNYHVFMMYKSHKGGQALTALVESPTVEFSSGRDRGRMPVLAGSASRHEKILTLTLTHAGTQAPLEVAVRLKGAAGTPQDAVHLTHAKLNAVNTAAEPTQIAPKPIEVKTAAGGASHVVVMPPASIVAVRFALT